MSVFYHNDDPLLRQQPQIFFQNTPNQGNNLSDAYAQMYKQQLMMELQQNHNPNIRDWVGDLDIKMKNLDNSTIEILTNDIEFSDLNSQLQSMIQSELMNLVKVKINSNVSAVENIKRQMDIMETSINRVKKEEKDNINELNDYIKNYSHLTFDEYKRIKNGDDNNSGETMAMTKIKTKKQ